MSDVCRKCGQPVIWAVVGSKRVPVDPAPLMRFVAPRGDRLDRLMPGARRLRSVPTYSVHFTTCPAGEHEGRAAYQTGEGDS